MKARGACLLGLLLLFGCADSQSMSKKGGSAHKVQDKAAWAKGEPELEVGAMAADPGDEKLAEARPPAQAPRPRKVLYSGQVELIVEDMDEAQKGLNEIIDSHKAFISHSLMTGEPHQPRSGTWTIRVPAADFRAFMDAVAGLGEARQRKIDSDDVTDQYYDTEAAALNLEAREKALRKLYDEKIAGSKLNELMEVDRELYKVRGDINTSRGRMKRWDDLASYSTLSLSMRDRKGYVPPESPDFGTTVSRSFSGSIDALVATAKALAVFLVVIAPWLAVLSVLGLVVALPVRATRRRARTTVQTRAAPPPAPPEPTE